jgi:hypothetical protein
LLIAIANVYIRMLGCSDLLGGCCKTKHTKAFSPIISIGVPIGRFDGKVVQMEAEQAIVQSRTPPSQ